LTLGSFEISIVNKLITRYRSVAMQPSKTKLSLAISAICLGVAGGASAATGTFDITATTLPDVTLTEVTALDYGQSMFVTQGGVCVMNAATPGDQSGVMQYDDATVGGLVAANYGDISGTGCVDGTGTGTPGVYKITGLPGGTVDITISGVNGTSFDFAPNSGCIVTFDGATAAESGDTCAPFVPGVSSSKLIPVSQAAEQGTTTVDGNIVAGELVFTVGGTVTIGGTDAVDLTANQAYSENFTVDVTY
jgi:hypothetical protein